MRINFGLFKGKKLTYNVPLDIQKAVSPTSSVVKSVLFNLLAHSSVLPKFSFADCFIADFCCGTGGVGFEFLSLGVANCTFVDEHFLNLESIQTNAVKLQISDKIITKAVDILNASLAQKKIEGKFDIIFIDPPYNKINQILPAFFALVKSKELLKEGAIIIVETNIDINPEGFEIILKRAVRKDRFLFFLKQI